MQKQKKPSGLQTTTNHLLFAEVAKRLDSLALADAQSAEGTRRSEALFEGHSNRLKMLEAEQRKAPPVSLIVLSSVLIALVTFALLHTVTH